MSCNKSTLQKHSAKVHEKDRKPEAIAPLTPNEEIEEWVCLMTLGCIMRFLFMWWRSTYICSVCMCIFLYLTKWI